MVTLVATIDRQMFLVSGGFLSWGLLHLPFLVFSDLSSRSIWAVFRKSFISWHRVGGLPLLGTPFLNIFLLPLPASFRIFLFGVLFLFIVMAFLGYTLLGFTNVFVFVVSVPNLHSPLPLGCPCLGPPSWIPYAYPRLNLLVILECVWDKFFVLSAIKCSSFVSMNVGTSMRSAGNPMGDCSQPSVRHANGMAARYRVMVNMYTSDN